MLLRATLVAGATAALLALTGGGTAHASCLDDAQARRLDAGFTERPKSEHWNLNYVDQSGTATVTVYGDALVSDYSTWFTVDWPAYLQAHATNAADVTTDFVDCVAG